MEQPRSYRDLIVWQRSTLVRKIYSSTRSFPKEEMYGDHLPDQAGWVSIPANIAEGQARNTKGEFVQFIGIARGSLAELVTLLEISRDLSYLASEDAEELLSGCGEVGRLLTGLKRSLERLTTNNQELTTRN